MKDKTKEYLMLGIIGGILTMIGDCLLVAKKKTFLPSWMWILNPLTFKLLINWIGRLGSSALLNGILCSNMSLGAILIFAAWWISLKKNGSIRHG